MKACFVDFFDCLYVPAWKESFGMGALYELMRYTFAFKGSVNQDLVKILKDLKEQGVALNILCSVPTSLHCAAICDWVTKFVPGLFENVYNVSDFSCKVELINVYADVHDLVDEDDIVLIDGKVRLWNLLSIGSYTVMSTKDFIAEESALLSSVAEMHCEYSELNSTWMSEEEVQNQFPGQCVACRFNADSMQYLPVFACADEDELLIPFFKFLDTLDYPIIMVNPTTPDSVV